MRLSTASALVVFVASAVASVHAHEDHDHDMQMPLDYVKFPYQAAYYPGDNDGMYIVFYFAQVDLRKGFRSDCGLDLLWDHDVRQAPLGAMSG